MGEDNSKEINESINAVSKGGGGTVYIPHGKYSVSTIALKSDVTLFLDEDAELISLE